MLLCADGLLTTLAVWLSFWLRLADPFHPSFISKCLWLLPTIWLIGLPLYAITGQYKSLTRYVGSHALYQLGLRNGLLVLLLFFCGGLFRLPMPPRTSWFLLWLLLTGFIGGVRFALRDVLLSLQNKRCKPLTRVAIYGAGVAGVQLAVALRLADTHVIALFLDDDPFLWRREIMVLSFIRRKYCKRSVLG